MNKPKIVFLPHANIEYSQLAPERRTWVIRESYRRLFELIDSGPYRIGFEASGETLRQMAERDPGTLEMLVRLMGEGKIEGVASPHTHIMLANIAPEVGVQSLIDGRDTWKQYTGVRPVVGWNPECSWNSHIPGMYAEAGFKTLVMDADSFLLSYPEIREATGLAFDVLGHSNKNKLFRIEDYIADKPDFLRILTNPGVAPSGLQLIFRSDMMANLMLWYLMGATEGVREEPVSLEEVQAMLAKWKQRIQQTGSFIMPYAEDAEYIGTSAYFYVKQFGQARFFEHEPESVDRFRNLLDAAIAQGYELSTPSDAIAASQSINPIDRLDCIENGVAWHGGTAKAWLNTAYARILDPVCREMLDGLHALNARTGKSFGTMQSDAIEALRLLTAAYVSDSRWPPAPTSPGRFNVAESLDYMKRANDKLEAAMLAEGLGEARALYSPRLMRTRIAAVEKELMDMPYFGEKAGE